MLAELEDEPDAAGLLPRLPPVPRAAARARRARPDAMLAHFVHIPWPQPDYWTVLPPSDRAARSTTGLLANDVVGFHTRALAATTSSSCEDVLGAEVDCDASVVDCDGRRTLVTAHPISVDPAEFDELARATPVLAAERRARRGAGREQLVLRVDRTDPSKNSSAAFARSSSSSSATPSCTGG